MPPVSRRFVVALLPAAAFGMPAAASAQTSAISADGAEVSTTPPGAPAGEGIRRRPPASFRAPVRSRAILALVGLAPTLIGFGLRPRTADADDD